MKRCAKPVWQGMRYWTFRVFSYLSYRVPLRIGTG